MDEKDIQNRLMQEYNEWISAFKNKSTTYSFVEWLIIEILKVEEELKLEMGLGD